MSARAVVPAVTNLDRVQSLAYEIDALACVVRIGVSDISKECEIDEGRLLVLTQLPTERAKALTEVAAEP